MILLVPIKVRQYQPESHQPQCSAYITPPFPAISGRLTRIHNMHRPDLVQSNPNRGNIVFLVYSTRGIVQPIYSNRPDQIESNRSTAALVGIELAASFDAQYVHLQ